MNENKININWFPGHMNKALKTIEKELKIVDVVIYVLDSRAPFSCVNPKFKNFINNKPVIYVFNKIDLAESDKINDWFKYFKSNNSYCLVMDSTVSKTSKKLEEIIKSSCLEKINKYKEKNINCVLRAMVIGVPNCGKSTLINNLCGKGKTITGNKPGVTKGKQWVKIASGIELLDTPGTLWPSFTNSIVARNLAYIGSIKEEVLDVNDLAFYFVKDVCSINKSLIENRYNIIINNEMETLEILDLICESRKFLLKGNEYDYDRCCKAIITDFKQGKFGKLTLEKYTDLKKLLVKDNIKNG